jgi:hypothetical protein
MESARNEFTDLRTIDRTFTLLPKNCPPSQTLSPLSALTDRFWRIGKNRGEGGQGCEVEN